MGDNLPGQDKCQFVNRPKVIRARAVIRRMRGRAHAHLVSTDNGLFVVKWKQNPIHRRVLINSLVGAELLRQMGIAVPEWGVIYADAAFCSNHAQNPQIEAGFHLGLRHPSPSGGVSVYDYIPHSLSHRIMNKADYPRVLVFDCWVDNAHLRRSIFTARDTYYYGQMVGNSYILGFRGGSWSFSDYPNLCLPLPIPLSAYVDTTAVELIETTIAQIQNIARDTLEGIPSLIPSDWIGLDRDNLQLVFTELVRRSKILPQMIHTLQAQLRQRFCRR